MYGYIRIHAPELKVREQEYYRAVYCGLCRTMGKCTGQCSRMTLSYDFTFFALVRMALTGERPVIAPRRCFAHPTRRRLMAESNETLRLCAYLSAVLAYHKVRDDLHDERGIKRTAATLIHPYCGSLRRRALRHDFAATDARVAEAMQELTALEHARPASVDAPADLFGNLMAALLAHGMEGREAILANEIGRHIGRYIYILDAADDYEEDVRTGRYNPFVCLYGEPVAPSLPADQRDEIRTALLSELADAALAFDLLETADDPDLGGVLTNILHMGLPRAVDTVLCGSCGESGFQPGRKPKQRRHKRTSK